MDTCAQLSCGGLLQKQAGTSCLSEPESQPEPGHLEVRFIPPFVLVMYLVAHRCFGRRKHLSCSAEKQGLLHASVQPSTKKYPVSLFSLTDDAFLSSVLRHCAEFVWRGVLVAGGGGYSGGPLCEASLKLFHLQLRPASGQGQANQRQWLRVCDTVFKKGNLRGGWDS